VITFSIRHKYPQICSNTAHTSQKCDDKRPCTTCISAHKATECKHEIGKTPPGHFNHSKFLLWDGPGPSDSTGIRRRGAVGETVLEPQTNRLPVSTPTRTPPEIVPPGRALIRTPAYGNVLFYTPSELHPTALNEIMKHNLSRITLPSFSVVSSLVSPSIPPGSHVTLSSLGAGGFQLSDVALEELSMKLCVSRVF